MPSSTAPLPTLRRRLAPSCWTVGPASAPAGPTEKNVPAEVPGAAQLDWARAENWPPYWQADNFRNYAWMESRYWIYRTRVPRTLLNEGERLTWVCGGVDYQCEVRLSGQVMHAQEGMFTPFEVDCTAAAEKGGDLEVAVFPTPIRPDRPVDRSQASACVKPPVSYGWDWHPRLIPLGIWEDTYFEIRPAAHFRSVEIRYTLSDDCGEARLRLAVETRSAAAPATLRWSLALPGEPPVWQDTRTLTGTAVEMETMLAEPALWWPHDHGTQPRYLLEAELLAADGAVLDRRQQHIGFRRVRLVMAPGAWKEPASFPKSRSLPPITIEINGRQIFARGTNWVNPEIFPGRCDAAVYRPLLQLARDAHMNLLRCWGGAPVQKTAFFELCDELGLMVWQEFPLACNLYPDDEAYLAVLDQESRSIVRRVRRHPSLALWCGGNELFNSWSGLTDQSLPLRLLNRNCYELDPGTPFLATAPLEGMAHGDYRFRDQDGREVHQIYAGSAATAYSEFGCPGPSPVAYLKTFIPEEELWPPRPGTAWQSHHAFDAWVSGTWLCLDTQRHYFGEPRDLDELVARGEWLQTAGYQCIFEEARRQKPRCSMALNWCFNEPWPTAANNTIVNWPAQPKPAYHAVAAACRPVMASARLPKFSWIGGELFSAGLWLLNDSPHTVPAGRIQATLLLGSLRQPLLTWEHPTASVNEHVVGPEVRCLLPEPRETDYFELELSGPNLPAGGSRYRLHLRPGRPDTGPVPGARFATQTMNT